MTIELFAIGISVLIVIGILLHHPSSTLGIPSLLVFMGVGLAVGNGELGFIYDNIQQTQMIGALALNMIVFVGGLNTSAENIRAAYKEGGVLSTLGVLLTTVIFAALMHWLFGFHLLLSLLIGAIVSSTDAAAVFSILESKKLRLKGRTDTVLEFESATNDPVALLMVMILTGLLVASDTQAFPGELFRAATSAVLPGLLLIFVARPLAVQICYLFFPKVSWQKRLFVSAIGLKGATPLVFALYPAAAGVPGAKEILNMVFFVVLISVVLQGGVLEPLARKLDLRQTEH